MQSSPSVHKTTPGPAHTPTLPYLAWFCPPFAKLPSTASSAGLRPVSAVPPCSSATCRRLAAFVHDQPSLRYGSTLRPTAGSCPPALSPGKPLICKAPNPAKGLPVQHCQPGGDGGGRPDPSRHRTSSFPARGGHHLPKHYQEGLRPLRQSSRLSIHWENDFVIFRPVPGSERLSMQELSPA